MSVVEKRLASANDKIRPETVSEANKILTEAKNLLDAAKTDLTNDKFFDAFDKANQALKISSLANALLSADPELRNIEDNPNRLAENIRRQDRQDNPGLKVEARVIANAADARVELRFITASTDRAVIAQEILTKLRLNRDQIAGMIDIKNELNQDLQTRSEARADMKDSNVEVKVKIRFSLSATDANEIINGIAGKLAAITLADIANALEIRTNDNSGQDNSNGNLDNSDRRGGESRLDDDGQATISPNSPSPTGLDIRQEDRQQDRQLELGDDRLFPQTSGNPSPTPTGVDVRGNADEAELRGRANEPGEDVRGNADEAEIRGGESGGGSNSNSGRR